MGNVAIQWGSYDRVVRLPVRMMGGLSKPLPVHLTYMVPDSPGVAESEAMAVKNMSMEAALGLMTSNRAKHKIMEGLLRMAVHYPAKVPDWASKHRLAIECQLTRTRPRCYLSLAIEYPRRSALCLTLEVSHEADIHAEEVLGLLDETYEKRKHRCIEVFAEDVAKGLRGYSRVRDYLVQGHQYRQGLGYVVQCWSGTLGGLRPPLGLTPNSRTI